MAKPLVEIVAWTDDVSTPGRVRVVLKCGHRVWVSTAATYLARCWRCAAEERDRREASALDTARSQHGSDEEAGR